MHKNLFIISIFSIIFIVSCVVLFLIKYKKVISNKKDYKLIVVTFSKLTKAQLNRYKHIAQHLPNDYNITFVTDRCSFIDILKPYKVFCFTIADFKSIFKNPNENMRGYCHNREDVFYMWTLCLESVVHSIKYIYKKYKYIWIIESDLAYSGNINIFFKKYDKNYSDLLSLPKVHITSLNEWCWYNCYTYEYMKWIQSYTPVERIYAYVMIVRISPILFEIVMSNIKLNRHTHCESTLHEAAIYNNLTISFFEKSDFGEKFGVDDRINISEWNMYNRNPLKQNKLYHALKF